MTSFARRRTISLTVTMLIALVMIAVYVAGQGTLHPDGFLSGWVLLGLVVFLALYNVRKVVPFLPLGTSADWLQFHIYCGFLSFLMFAVHVRFSLPGGIFERCLALIYLSVFGSGIIGLYLTRTYPKRLTDLGNEIIFEQVPIARRQLQDQIEALIQQCGSENAESVIPDFYRNRIRPFMTGQYHILSHLMRGASRRHQKLLRAIADQTRYLNDEERGVMMKIESIVNRRHQLNTQHALQAALKLWLFFHVPATWALLIFAVFHSILVHAWFGGLP